MQITYQEYFDKVLGGWVGKCAGGILGAPIEGYKRFNDIVINDQLFETNFANDDLDLQVLWLDMVMKKSASVTESDFAEHWKNHVGFPWNEYGIALRNLKVGIQPPESGRLNNYYWKNSMGCPIRSEIWGMLCPGMPEKAAFYAGMDGSIDHFGFSVEAEQYFSVCAAIAFSETDILTVLERAKAYIPEHGEMNQLVDRVMNWAQINDSAVVMSKIKSYYGDADFTSAPMNVAFTILTLINSKTDFSCIAEALHMGHDSDCIVATAGALIGIIKGYSAIPELWKKRVGEEILISEAITDIYKPSTIFELTEATCQEGLKFLKYYEHDFIKDNRAQLIGGTRDYCIKVDYPTWNDQEFVRNQQLRIKFKNNSNVKQSVSLEVNSDGIEPAFLTFSCEPFCEVVEVIEINLPVPAKAQNSFDFYIKVLINNFIGSTEKFSLPYYGSWLLLGPFIQDDKTLEPCDEKYPEHGMSSMPSAIYMNHDKVNSGYEFLEVNTIKKLINSDLNQLPFHTSLIHCSSFNIPFSNAFYGKGERTLYLYSNLNLQVDSQFWVCLGCTALVTVFVNGSQVYKSDRIKRCWPAAHVFLQRFNAGVNEVCIRLDTLLDESRLEFGLKEFEGEHQHQSHWSTLIPFVEAS
jgi:ADP-ribosylglycohydrolase